MIDSGTFLSVRYSCPVCGINQRKIDVRARGEEDVVVWLEQVCMVDVSRDHSMMSPECCAKHVRDLMIPLSGAGKVGGVIQQ